MKLQLCCAFHQFNALEQARTFKYLVASCESTVVHWPMHDSGILIKLFGGEGAHLQVGVLSQGYCGVAQLPCLPAL